VLVAVQTLRSALRPRAYVRAEGRDAAEYLQRMLSNDVAALPVGGSCPALLLTAKARVIAPLVLWRRGEEDYLLLTESELGERVLAELRRFRFAAKVELEPEEHVSRIVFGDAVDGIQTGDYGEPAVEVLDAEPVGEELDADELELLRILARTPRHGKEIDDRVLPAEAGLTDTHVDFKKGCYPGQEPIARLHYRGHANRGLRLLALAEPPEPEAEVVHEGKAVGRITSAARSPERGAVALAYVRAEVPDDAELRVGDLVARQLH
jgi:folate-binding protein YgfZ